MSRKGQADEQKKGHEFPLLCRSGNSQPEKIGIKNPAEMGLLALMSLAQTLSGLHKAGNPAAIYEVVPGY